MSDVNSSADDPPPRVRPSPCGIRVMHRPRPSLLLPLIWIVIGLIVAATHHFFDHVGTIGAILSAILAVQLWPLILLGVKLAIAI